MNGLRKLSISRKLMAGAASVGILGGFGAYGIHKTIKQRNKQRATINNYMKTPEGVETVRLMSVRNVVRKLRSQGKKVHVHPKYKGFIKGPYAT